MIHPFIEGIVLGLTLSILMGPAFFTLIQTSIHRGFRSGFYLALGVMLSDLSLILLCYLGLSQIMDNSENNLAFGVIGGLILVVFGIITFRRKVHMDENNNTIIKKTPKVYTYIMKGYFLNIANPFILIFWMGVMGVVRTNLGMNMQAVLTFFVGTLVTVFSMDVLKCFIANKIKQYLTPKIMTWINHVIGALLVVFGIVLIAKVIIEFLY